MGGGHGASTRTVPTLLKGNPDLFLAIGMKAGALLRSMLFQRPGECLSFIPEDYSRQHTGMAESKMGEEEA